MDFDGDNDWWRAHIGHNGPVDRGGSCHVRNYSWPDWEGEWRFDLQPGWNAVYVTGRSRGIGIDRIAVYAMGRKTTALNPVTAASTPGVSVEALASSRSTAGTGAHRVRAQGRLLTLTAPSDGDRLQVCNLNGTVVADYAPTPNSRTVSLDLPAGSYLASLLRDGHRVASARVVIR